MACSENGATQYENEWLLATWQRYNMDQTKQVTEEYKQSHSIYVPVKTWETTICVYVCVRIIKQSKKMMRLVD